MSVDLGSDHPDIAALEIYPPTYHYSTSKSDWMINGGVWLNFNSDWFGIYTEISPLYFDHRFAYGHLSKLKKYRED